VGSTHAQIGLTLAVALGLENLPLGLAIADHLRHRHPPRRWKLVVAAGLMAVLPVGLGVGAAVGDRLQGALFTGMVAFGAAALLFLATEQLIVEAHATKHAVVEPGVVHGLLVGDRARRSDLTVPASVLPVRSATPAGGQRT